VAECAPPWEVGSYGAKCGKEDETNILAGIEGVARSIRQGKTILAKKLRKISYGRRQALKGLEAVRANCQ